MGYGAVRGLLGDGRLKVVARRLYPDRDLLQGLPLVLNRLNYTQVKSRPDPSHYPCMGAAARSCSELLNAAWDSHRPATFGLSWPSVFI